MSSLTDEEYLKNVQTAESLVGCVERSEPYPRRKILKDLPSHDRPVKRRHSGLKKLMLSKGGQDGTASLESILPVDKGRIRPVWC